MSGGGLWRIAEFGCQTDEWSLNSLKLIGIQSSYYLNEQVIRATRVQHLLGMIYRGHENLRSEMESYFEVSACMHWLNG